jgi:hypothetical protein
VYTVSGSVARVYVDGVEVIAQSGLTVSDPASTTLIGKHPVFAQELSNGWRVDDFRIYSAPLSEATILEHYAGGVGIPCVQGEANLLECWPLDETSGVTVSALVDAGNNGYVDGSNYSWGVGHVPTEGVTATISYVQVLDGVSPGESSRTYVGDVDGATELLGKVVATLPVYANNAAALAGGLNTNDLYRTGGDPDVVAVVH